MSEKNNHHFWKSKKVLITGHTGFKGSWLSLWLQYLGTDVIGYSLEPITKPNMFTVANVADDMTSIIGDVRDYSHLYEICNKHKPDIVIHLAAQSLVKYSYLNPVETFSTNIAGTVNVLEVVRNIGCIKSVVIITSDKCYENKVNNVEHIESDAMGGHDPYSSSKGCAELVTKSYIDSYFNQDESDIAVATARAGNAIGGGDWAQDRLITDIVYSLSNNEMLDIRYPDAIRPWQHVLEPLSGYLLLAEKLFVDGHKYSGAWNFGPDNQSNKTVKWIVEKISDILNIKIDWSVTELQSLYESKSLTLNCNKSKNELNWMPRLTIEETIEWIVSWYKTFLDDNSDMKKISIEQIKKYELMS